MHLVITNYGRNSVPSSQPLARLTLALTLVGSLQGYALPLQAQTDAQWLADRMSSWYQRAQRTSPGEWGIAVADQSGRMLWSVKPDQPLEAAAEALAAFGVAGEDAAREAKGPGSFHVGLYDALAALDPDTLDARAKVS